MKNKIIVIILIFSISLLSTIFIVQGFDYYWHISAGNYMINNHTILIKDVFSWSIYNKTWISHEWLFEIVIYILNILFNKYSTIIYCFTTIFVLLMIIFMNNNNYKKNMIFTLIWLALFIITNSYCIIPRPQLLSNIFLAITIYLLYNLLKNEDSNKIYILPFITILWTNIHGGSSNLSYILIIVFMFVGILPINNKYIKTKKLTKKQIKKYLIVLSINILFININPHGFNMLLYPYINMSNILMQKNITEWQPIFKITPNNYIYFLFMIILLVILIKNKNKLKTIDIVLLIIFGILGIKSFRFANYLYIVSSFFIFDYIKIKKEDKNTNMLLLITSILIITLFTINLPSTVNRLNTNYISKEMIDKIKEENPKRLFNLYDYGGYLIYNDIKVFIDGRADLYSNYNYEDYINISNNINTKEIINKYKFDYFLVNDKYSINKYLKDNNYKIIFSDNNILYKKKDT